MNYWWVNHKQTHSEEIEGGYIWSPERNNDGSTNQTYLNLTKVLPNDIVFSYANGEIKAIGTALDKYSNKNKPTEFGSTGEQWGNEGWLVQISWILLATPFSPKLYISRIAPLLPEKYSPIQKNGNGNQGCYLANISHDLGNLLIDIASTSDHQIHYLIRDNQQTRLEDAEEHHIWNEDIPETEKKQLVKARIGQGVFRLRLEKIEKHCRMTGVIDKILLVASHIKPWRYSNNIEKLDGNNGLLLSPHVDKLFDKGLISFSNSGDILCANKDIEAAMRTWGLDPAMNVGAFNKRQQKYLEYHRIKIYKEWCKS